MTIFRERRDALRLAALLLLLTTLSLLAELPLHRALHPCADGSCHLCLSLSRWQEEGFAPIPPRDLPAASAADLRLFLLPQQHFPLRTPALLKTKMNN